MTDVGNVIWCLLVGSWVFLTSNTSSTTIVSPGLSGTEGMIARIPSLLSPASANSANMLPISPRIP